MHIFLSGTLCGGSAAVRTQWAQPAEHSGMKTSRFPATVWGGAVSGLSAHRGLALPAGCLRLQLAKAAEALPSERQLENAAHVLFPRNTSFFMVWQPSPSRGPVMPSC